MELKDAPGQTPLVIAVPAGNNEIFELLLDVGAVKAATHLGNLTLLCKAESV